MKQLRCQLQKGNVQCPMSRAMQPTGNVQCKSGCSMYNGNWQCINTQCFNNQCQCTMSKVWMQPNVVWLNHQQRASPSEFRFCKDQAGEGACQHTKSNPTQPTSNQRSSKGNATTQRWINAICNRQKDLQAPSTTVKAQKALFPLKMRSDIKWLKACKVKRPRAKYNPEQTQIQAIFFKYSYSLRYYVPFLLNFRFLIFSSIPFKSIINEKFMFISFHFY